MLKFENEKYALFSGIEQEGPRAGDKTLFIVGDVPANIIVENLVALKNRTHLYFGAGGRFDYNLEVLKTFLFGFGGHSYYPDITVESPVYNEELYSLVKEYEGRLKWFIPCIYGGTPLVEGLSTISSLLSKQMVDDCFYLKIDAMQTVTISDLAYTNMNSYERGYSEDKLLVSSVDNITIGR
ncbi:MAG: hypothetical protein ACRYGG_00985 [Janthinobacterium lividum]